MSIATCGVRWIGCLGSQSTPEHRMLDITPAWPGIDDGSSIVT